jgi:hypothetical protein
MKFYGIGRSDLTDYRKELLNREINTDILAELKIEIEKEDK